MNGWTAITVFVLCFLLAGAAGFAAILRSERQLSMLTVVSSVLNSAFLGLCVSLLWYTNYRENLYFLVGVSTFAGFGGATITDLIINVIKTSLSKPGGS